MIDLNESGKFIANIRKEKGLTQSKLAEKIQVSEKTISKWECGKGFPDVASILPLCEALEITSNELLSAKRLSETEYHQSAHENALELINEKKRNKKQLWFAYALTIALLIGACTLLLITPYAPMWLMILLIVEALVMVIGGCVIVCFMDNDAGYYECPHCKTRFKPTMEEYIKGIRNLTTRKLKCPHCGEKTYCKKRLSKK
ncbi:MAG: helix-turn-helix domain-containing protein [Clostridia bacterium]|nr:helix-turn-helix domain-containing protein [Clostridia bacterium]